MKDNGPFRITIEHWDEKVTVEVDHSDVDFEEVWDLVKKALRGAGYESLVKELEEQCDQ